MCDNFSINNHLFFHTVGDEKVQDVMGKVSDLSSTHMDRNFPLWKVDVVQDAVHSKHVLLIRIHHVLGDGLALIGLLQGLLKVADAKQTGFDTSVATGRRRQTKEEGAKIQAEANEETKEKIAQVGSTFTNTKKLRKINPLLKAAIIARMVLSAPYTGLEIAFTGKDKSNPFQFKPEDVSLRKKTMWSNFALDKVKELSKNMRVTVNDVLAACVTGGIRAYLTHVGHKVVDMKAVVPVSMRPMNEFKSGRVQMNNQVAAVFLKLPVSEADPVKRVKTIKRRMDKFKVGPHAFIIGASWKMVSLLPPKSILRLQNNYLARCSLILTNVPGPRKMGKIWDLNIEEMQGFVPLLGSLGLGIALFSYGNVINVAVMTDDKVKDPQVLLNGIAAEFAILCDAAGIQPPAKKNDDKLLSSVDSL
jgi:WS/DGAT/MGAT family acyltransferase